VSFLTSSTSTTALIALGILFSVGGAIRGMLRTVHPEDGSERGMRRHEAYGTNIVVSLYAVALMVTLP
jgi:hypothetical protein